MCRYTVAEQENRPMLDRLVIPETAQHVLSYPLVLKAVRQEHECSATVDRRVVRQINSLGNDRMRA